MTEVLRDTAGLAGEPVRAPLASTQPMRVGLGRVDRSRTLGFTFDGKTYLGHPGDTLASALLANGVRLLGRSFKYHRPRGLLSAGPEEPNALVELRSGARQEPNTRATVVELWDGLEAQSQNRWPNLRFDALGVNDLFSPFFTAGFYYKTFMWPAAFWEKLYEPIIRRAAGLGSLSREAFSSTPRTSVMCSTAATTRSFLVGKWCSWAPRLTPARCDTSVVEVPAKPCSARHSTVASSRRARIARVRSSCGTRVGELVMAAIVPPYGTNSQACFFVPPGNCPRVVLSPRGGAAWSRGSVRRRRVCRRTHW